MCIYINRICDVKLLKCKFIKKKAKLRESEQNSFHYNFLIYQQHFTTWLSLELTPRDDSNGWSYHRVWLRNKNVTIWTLLFVESMKQYLGDSLTLALLYLISCRVSVALLISCDLIDYEWLAVIAMINGSSSCETGSHKV